MSFNSVIDKLIYPGDKLNPDTYRKGKFFVISFLVFLVFCVLGSLYCIYTGLGGTATLIVNSVICFLVPTFLFIYKKFGGRTIFVNLIAVLGYSSYSNTYHLTGGIFSSDFASGIVVCCWIFLVADKISGLVWFCITFCTIFFFYYASVNGWKDFRADAVAQGDFYPFMNFGFGCIFIAFIILVHEKNKEKYLKELITTQTALETKSKELALKNKDTTDSINYAKKIQYAVLPTEETIYRSIPLSFIYYQPKDIVSGDFFWFHEIDRDTYILVCADCTGHGVPGAFMTVIGSSLLNQIVIEDKIHEPAQILMELDRRIVMTLKQEKEKTLTVQDGMDLSLLKVNKATKEFIVTSAKRPVVFIRDKELQEIKGSKFSLGGMRSGEKHFEEIKINFREDDMLYFFTDGYTDQFGGEKGKKFSSRKLKETFLALHHLPVLDQKQKIAEVMDKWKGEVEQVDDMLVMGIKF